MSYTKPKASGPFMPNARNWAFAKHMPAYGDYLERTQKEYMNQPIHPMFAKHPLNENNNNNENAVPIVIPLKTRTNAFAGAKATAKGTFTAKWSGGRRRRTRQTRRRRLV